VNGAAMQRLFLNSRTLAAKLWGAGLEVQGEPVIISLPIAVWRLS